jgi:hypothetical protein
MLATVTVGGPVPSVSTGAGGEGAVGAVDNLSELGVHWQKYAQQERQETGRGTGRRGS